MTTDFQFMTHEPWCSWFLDDEYESCDCGYREDLYIEEDAKFASGNEYNPDPYKGKYRLT